MKPPRILVVDDDRATRHVARVSLMKAGFTVRVAKDGVKATLGSDVDAAAGLGILLQLEELAVRQYISGALPAHEPVVDGFVETQGGKNGAEAVGRAELARLAVG